jgi:Uncharacterized conserved protein (DUF2183)
VSSNRRGFVVRSAAAAAASLLTSRAWSALEDDEGVVVLPSTARRLDGGHVELRVQAWVYEREGRRMATRALAKLLGLDLDQIDAADRSIFVERTKLFAREAQARRRLRLQLSAGTEPGGQAARWFDLPASRRDGGVDIALPLPPSAVNRDGADAIEFELIAGARRFPGRAYVTGPEGLSIVSDIDDTIKHTQVRDRRQMLLNTFARLFTAVPGMAAWYAQIAQAAPISAGHGTAFHYVSSAPWALASALEGFLHEHAFPAGSLHLRAFSLQPQALLSKSASSTHKHATIERLLADQPRRRFVLIGDSGEQDPEIYGAIARRHPDRIAAILVRDVTGDRVDGDRYRQALVGVPQARWSIFDDPAHLPRRWD